MKLQKWLLLAVFSITIALMWQQQYFSFAKNEVKLGRLLIAVEKTAGFSPEQFAKASQAKLVSIDPRNPFKSLNQVYLDQPLVVISDKPISTISPFRVASKFGYRYLSLSNATVEEALKEVESYLAKAPKYSSEIPYLSKEDSSKMYDLMQKLDLALTENHITYWATAGTLLGAVRHHGLIPWDDDIDICIFDRDEKKLKSMQEIFDKYGLEIHSYWKDFYKVYPKDGKLIPDNENPGAFLPFKYPFADIFPVTLERNKEYQDVYVHKSKEFYFAFINERFEYSQLEIFTRVPFGPITIPIPQNAETFLNMNYGTKDFPELWKWYAVEPTWVHKSETSSKIGGASYVEVDDFLPAPL